jgi:uncharacterized protein YaaR (DUF327 family)
MKGLVAMQTITDRKNIVKHFLENAEEYNLTYKECTSLVFTWIRYERARQKRDKYQRLVEKYSEMAHDNFVTYEFRKDMQDL